MKLKDLLKGRDKLRKYDELKQWKDRFNSPQEDVDLVCGFFIIKGGLLFPVRDIYPIPADIKQIIVDAIDAEMRKLEDE